MNDTSFTLRALASLCLGLLIVGQAADAAASPAVGSPAPAFSTQGSDGKTHALADYKGKFVVLEWLNHGCPYVRKHYESGNMQALQKKYTGKGVAWLSIVSSAPGKQGYVDAAEAAKQASEHDVAATAILLDPSGEIGRAYAAKTTPHMFVIDPNGALIYEGAIDDQPYFDADTVAGAKNYVAQALDEAMAGKPVSNPETRAYGCSVKYE